MSWESPINVIIGEAEAKVEGDVFKVIQHYGIDVDKGELLKALSYDRGQYDRGWSDGYAQAKEDIVRCKDCAYGVKTSDVDILLCSRYGNTHYDTFYCAEGERKDEQTDYHIENDGTYEGGE